MDTQSAPSLPVRGAPVRVIGPVAATAAIALCIAIVLALFWPTTVSMVEIWRRSETFQHCFLVIPIALWLVWDDRQQLASTAARPCWPGLLLIAAVGAVWSFGNLASAQVISHFAVIGLIPVTVLTVFGTAWVRVLWFPLAFLFFAVPFGEALVPQLMDWTADFTVAALRLSGVPVYREATHFVIPTGQWSVIEACSGIKFLIASLMGGTLYAWLMYRSPGKRIAFVAASIVVPVLANWLRAYAIVMIGHLSHNRLMNNEDHIVFGWILFGAIMLSMYWWGTRWREDGNRTFAPAPTTVSDWGRGNAAAAAAAVAVLATFPPITSALMHPAGEPGPPDLVAPAPRGGWQPGTSPVSEWAPELDGASASKTWVFESGGDRVQLFVAGYRQQAQAAQVGSSTNQLVRTTNLRWKQVARDTAEVADPDGAALPRVLRSGEVRGASASERILVWHWYYSRGRATTSEADTKLDVARARLLRQPDTALWVALSTPIGTDRVAAERTLAAFAREMGPSLAVAFRESTQK